MQAAIKLNGSNSVSYKPTAAALSRTTYSEIQLDFRTTQSNAFLMLFGNSSATSMVRIYWLQAKIALKSISNYACERVCRMLVRCIGRLLQEHVF